MTQAQPLASVKTRHKEYALILTMFTIPALLYLQHSTSLLIVVLINLLALMTILGSAFSVVRHADVLAHRFGEPVGSLILSLAVVILEVSLISALMMTGDTGPTLMRDTLYSVIMIVMSGLVGISLMLGGRKFATQHVNLAGIKQYLTALLPLTIIILVLPATFREGTFSAGQLLIIALISAAMYLVFLTIQTKTHQSLFVYEHEDEDPDDHHGKPSEHSTSWHGIWLVIHLVSVIAVTKINAGSLESLLQELDAPPQFSGFLIALLILSPEGLGALRAVMANQVQRAMNLFFGSILATISLTVPAVVIIAAITGQNLIFGLSMPNIVLLITILLLCQSSFATGRTNVLNGAAHLAVFIAYLLVLMMG
ncbi:MAG: sodium-potassium/proton antiporter ChaA [Enterobacteriaceae bacterium]|jgi:Ca2+:H+ antiporter|nr:sodium-potassium/proton antiporter ChaA [Enterobacteriaceae bacterium]